MERKNEQNVYTGLISSEFAQGVVMATAEAIAEVQERMNANMFDTPRFSSLIGHLFENVLEKLMKNIFQNKEALSTTAALLYEASQKTKNAVTIDFNADWRGTDAEPLYQLLYSLAQKSITDVEQHAKDLWGVVSDLVQEYSIEEWSVAEDALESMKQDLQDWLLDVPVIYTKWLRRAVNNIIAGIAVFPATKLEAWLN